MQATAEISSARPLSDRRYIKCAFSIPLLLALAGFSVCCRGLIRDSLLKADHETVEGTVVGARSWKPNRGSREYELSIRFVTKEGLPRHDDFRVSRSTYDNAVKHKNVSLTYRPADLTNCQLGTHVTVRYFEFILSVVGLGIGAAIFRLGLRTAVNEETPNGRDPSAYFSEADGVFLLAIALKLKEPANVVDRYIGNQLSSRTDQLLAEFQGPNSDTSRLKRALVGDLNRIISGPSIYSADDFAQVVLRPETRQLLSQSPEWDACRLNRMLLEDVYPQELPRMPEPPASTGAETQTQQQSLRLR